MSLFSVPLHATRLVPLAVLVTGLIVPLTAPAGPKTAQKKETRRQAQAQAQPVAPEQLSAEALALEADGDNALAEGGTAEAVTRYKAALERVGGDSPQRRKLVTKFADASIKLADEQGKNGQLDAAALTLNAVLDDQVAPKYKPALKMRDRLQDPDRYNPAQTPKHIEETKKVRDLHIMARGFLDSADLSAAKGCFNQILAADPTNIAAARGLEEVERLTSNYLRAARDHTRLKMINDVDRQWESPVIASRPVTGRGAAVPSSEPAAGYSAASVKMRTIVFPRLAMSDTPLREALSYLVTKSRELDLTEANPDARGVNIIFNPSGKPENTFPSVNLDLNNVTLGDALKAITDLTQTRTGTQGNTITVTPLGVASRIVIRRFRVSPGFLTKSGTASVDAGGGGNDPFASGGDQGGGSLLKISRTSAKEWLERNGVPFPEGTSADYIPADNVLMVRNTEENLALVDTVIESTMDKSQNQVMVTVTMLKTEQRNLEELGYDMLLGGSNLGKTGTFISGGTVGNAAIGGAGLASNYSFVDPATGLANGVYPVTAGLRGASGLKSNPSIDDIIANGVGAGSGGRSPGILGLGAVWTDPQATMMLRGLNQKKGIDISTAQKLVLKAGQRATASSIRQIPYPTEFDPPQIPQTINPPSGAILFDPDGGFEIFGGGSAGTAPVTPTTPQSFEFKDTGSSLEIEATVSADGTMVDISVSAVFSEFDGFINYGTPITTGDVVLTDNNIFQPVFSKVAVNSPSLSIADGSTLTIGGLSEGKWSTIEDKVPLLGDIPFVGRFFRSDVKEVTRKAVVYFIKVNVVDPGGVGQQEQNAAEEREAAEAALSHP